MAATLVATTLLFAALLPLARPDQRDIPLPSFGTDIELSAPAPIPPTTAPRRPTRGPAIRRAETVSPIPSTENETRNSAETYAALEAAPATIAEFEWEPATEPLASQLTISGEWLIAPGLTAPAMPRAGAASGPAEASFDPGLFRGMYLTFGLLQGADVFSTIVAVKSGAREANPLMRVLADSPAPLIAVKATATVATVYLIERIRKRSPVVAAVTLAAIDSAYGVVVMHNVRVIKRLRETSALKAR
jgi:hypothetical protein